MMHTDPVKSPKHKGGARKGIFGPWDEKAPGIERETHDGKHLPSLVNCCPPHHFVLPEGVRAFRGTCVRCGEQQGWDPNENRVKVLSKAIVPIGNVSRGTSKRFLMAKDDSMKLVEVGPETTVGDVLEVLGTPGHEFTYQGQILGADVSVCCARRTKISVSSRSRKKYNWNHSGTVAQCPLPPPLLYCSWMRC